MPPGEGEPATDRRYQPVPPVPRPPDDARAYPLADGVWLLRLPLSYPVAPSVNAYLLECADGYLLVDCGSSLEAGWAGLERALALAGVEPGAVIRLVTTHHHSDHAGLVATVIERTGCAYAHLAGPTPLTEPLREHDRPLDERRTLADEQGIPGWLADLWITNHPAGDGRTAVPPGDSLLQEGDVLETRIGSWTVHPGPGHSISQLMLHHEASGRLITADVILQVDVPYVEWRHARGSFGDYLGSIERARQLAPSVLLRGHGRPVEDVESEIGAALDRGRALRESVLALVRAGALTPFELMCRLVGDGADLDTRQLALSTVLSVLDHLELEGTVVSEHDDAGVRLVHAPRRA
jgi:glyoxylase-like metal-dependent hydrolase (beta-lactamase superfamily II)